MNERIIQRLAVEAGFFASTEVEKFQRFAELVVQECTTICMRNQFDGSPLYNNGSVSSAELIKEYFGVRS